MSALSERPKSRSNVVRIAPNDAVGSDLDVDELQTSTMDSRTFRIHSRNGVEDLRHMAQHELLDNHGAWFGQRVSAPFSRETKA